MDFTLNLTDIASAWLTPLIAIVAVYIAFQQWRVNRENLKERLFERRMKVFRETQQYLSEIMREAKISNESIIRFNSTHQMARFLFGKEIQEYLIEIRSRSINMTTAQKMYKDLPVGDERSEWIDKEYRELKWLVAQLDTIFDTFEPYLGFEKHR